MFILNEIQIKIFYLYLLLITLLPNNNLCPTSLLIANETNFPFISDLLFYHQQTLCHMLVQVLYSCIWREKDVLAKKRNLQARYACMLYFYIFTSYFLFSEAKKTNTQHF